MDNTAKPQRAPIYPFKPVTLAEVGDPPNDLIRAFDRLFVRGDDGHWHLVEDG
jgi:hypothetical protein